ncbi:hypothetical protein PSTG_17156 [Puccinia striiformis f. sp. tritici PST-78]|uniref:Reverse transcriptase domain-containing protein n=2 Tax=Puccinia striiformis f. sp. tritici TaxID=168172 RepID=A0A0L0UQR4_9BASI|nr:hypothetical protein PSTG_17156 [Puccinia striiformis f. sp. tritici PST-78]
MKATTNARNSSTPSITPFYHRNPNQQIHINEPTNHSTLIDTSFSSSILPKRPHPDGVTTEVRNLKFKWGVSNSHTDSGFAPFFHKNISELKGFIPLTIFNKEWQARALAWNAENRSKVSDEDKGLKYWGLKVPNKYCMSFSDWTLNYTVFYETMRFCYKFETLGQWIILHKENCDKILRKDGFMTALRYDIKIRTNAWQFKPIENGEEYVSDFSKLKPETYEEAYGEARNNDELQFKTSNPYEIGGPREKWEAITGTRPTKGVQGIPDIRAVAPPASATPLIRAPITGTLPTLPSRPAQTRHQRPGSGYQGNNFNPSYARNNGRQGNRNREYLPEPVINAPGESDSHELVLNERALSPSNLDITQVEWPETVSCEMNIGEWRAALQRNNLLDEFADVIDGFINGFHQGIPTHDLGRDWFFFTPPNHQGALIVREKIEESIQKEITAKRMFGPYTKQQVHKKFSFFRTNPLGAAINGDGSIRPINDLSFPRDDLIPSVNSFVDKHNYNTTWDDFRIVSKFFCGQNQPLLLAIFDWEKAYRQIPTAKDQWPYLMIQDFNEQILIDTRIAFGGVAGCGSFGRPADAWKHIMLNEFPLLAVFRWVDDNLFVKTVDTEVDLDQIVEQSNRLGVKTNPTKISPFLEEQKYIGFVWNATKKTVRLPQDKKFQRIQQLKDFLDPSRNFNFNEVEIMAGRLNHVSYLLPQLRCYINSLYRWMNSWINRSHPLPVPNDARIDLEYWLKTMLFLEDTRIIQNPDPTEIGWVGDASTGFGIGILIGRRWAQFELTREWDDGPEPKRDIAWLETVAIRLGLLVLTKLGAIPGKVFNVWTDNTTTENCIAKRKSKHLQANEEWKIIQDKLVEMQIDITSKRVTSENNKADALSRGDRSRHLAQDMVPIIVPFDLENRMFQTY